MQAGDSIPFSEKSYKYVQELSQGGTGRTILIEDGLMNKFFVCKKYDPYYKEHRELFFQNFISEIKILHEINHNNVVRIYNYYLYPKQNTGYIIMEHIEGKDICSYLMNDKTKINNLFEDAIRGFAYLESKGILHRDIRFSNFLVDKNSLLKIIDFGFGKTLVDEFFSIKSVSLNWAYETPEEFNNKKYNHKTEVYFLGKMFEDLIEKCGIDDFIYGNILEQMVKKNPNQRVDSFSSIENMLVDKTVGESGAFTSDEIEIYRNFADNLMKLITKRFYSENEILVNFEEVLHNLEDLYDSVMLEDYLPDNSRLIACLVEGGYRYKIGGGYVYNSFQVCDLKNFINFLKSLSGTKKTTVMNHLISRMKSIPREDDPNKDEGDTIDINDLPF